QTTTPSLPTAGGARRNAYFRTTGSWLDCAPDHWPPSGVSHRAGRRRAPSENFRCLSLGVLPYCLGFAMAMHWGVAAVFQ
ncbi:MAG: hypothetical protein WCG66_07035, partial [bacterium]